MPIPLWVTRVNRRVTNPLLGTISDWLPPLATLHHVGRRTGRRFRTPVLAFPTERGVAIALTYGTEVQWLRNLEADGPARLVRQGQVLAVSDPVRLRGEAGLRWMPPVVRAALALLRVDVVVDLAAVRLEPRRGR